MVPIISKSIREATYKNSTAPTTTLNQPKKKFSKIPILIRSRFQINPCCIAKREISLKNLLEMKIFRQNISIAQLIKSTVIFFIFFISLCLLRFIKWFSKNFHSATFEQIIFFLNVPLEGAESEFVRTFFTKVLLFAICITLLLIALKVIGFQLAKKENRFGKLFSRVMPYFNTAICLTGILILIFSGIRINKMFNVNKNLQEQYNANVSQFYEKYYVDPQKAQIKPPSDGKKWNLIVVYLESMEKTFTDKALMPQNLTPHLSEMAVKNQSFSHFKQGYAQMPTQPALVSSMIGVPITYLMQIGRYLVVGGSLSEFAPNAFSVGQVLEKEGYQNLYVQGTNGRFSGTDVFLKSHGFNMFYDMNHMIDRYKNDQAMATVEAKIKNRFYDEYTYKFFKEKITQLSDKKPFFAVMATIDTHFGNETPNSRKLFPTETENTIYHASYLAHEFLEWVKKQPFAKNTTVVFIGDHLMMRSGGRKNKKAGAQLFKKVPNDSRFIFNTFIHARKKAPYLKREFTQVDIFPSLIESIGYEIEGSRLGLGTSIFSKRKTLIEELGEAELNKELKKKNLLYNSLWESSKN